MDLHKLILLTSAIFLIYLLTYEAEAGKRRRKYPVKPLFGVGIGYKKVVHYKPVLVFQKHKHHKGRRIYHHGWGWRGWGWHVPRYHGHGHGHGGGGHHHGGGGGHHHGGGGGHHHGGGGGHHHGGGHGHHGGYGGWEDDGGYGWGGYEEDPYEDYGGWESEQQANWNSPSGSNNKSLIIDNGNQNKYSQEREVRNSFQNSNTSPSQTVNYQNNHNQVKGDMHDQSMEIFSEKQRRRNSYYDNRNTDQSNYFKDENPLQLVAIQPKHGTTSTSSSFFSTPFLARHQFRAQTME